MRSKPLTWVEINEANLRHNIKEIRGLIGPDVLLNVVVKSNAYGHDLVIASKIFVDSGADWLSVHSINEAQTLRDAGIKAPIYILGYVQISDLEQAIRLDCRMVVYNLETIKELGRIDKPVNVHIKIETGTHRQGVLLHELENIVAEIQKHKNISIEGLSTHFANVEDTTDDKYFRKQLAEFQEGVAIVENIVGPVPIKHCAAAAATILFPESHYQMVRIGVSVYGMWPSEKTKNAYEATAGQLITLQPAFTWKSRIAQIKRINEGESIGYGCAYTTDKETTMAVVPIGYYDGYVRAVGGKAHVLVHGHIAPVLGRVSMNNIVIDISGLRNISIEEEVVLLGKQGDQEITSEMFASWADTINYEIPTRIAAGTNANIPRIVV